MNTSRFENFTKSDYDAIFARLASGEIKLSTTLGDDAHLGLGVSLVEIVNIG